MSSVEIALADLERDPHPALARLRASAPAAWVPALDAWLVTGYAEALAVLRDARTFTVDDPRFSTARVVGPSMLSLDGAQHGRHRGPFTGPFRHDAVYAQLAAFTEKETDRLVTAIAASGAAELRRSVAGPLAVAVMAEALGLSTAGPDALLAWYDEIVAATAAQASEQATAQAGERPPGRASAAFGELAAALRQAMRGPASMLSAAAGQLTEDEIVSNAAVLLFGGIETTEGMITNVMLHLLTSPAGLARVSASPELIPAAIEESLRLEPAAAVVDRYATAGIVLGTARIKAGDQVTVSIAGANRDPAVFPAPDEYRVDRANAGRHLAFAHGPHFCLGVHLARLEARVAVAAMLARLPGLRLDPAAGDQGARGLVFRKPPSLVVRWETGRSSVSA
jgi:cytochrome P450